MNRPSLKRLLLEIIPALALFVTAGRLIFLNTADLGRHLVNGKYVLEGHFRDVLTTNFYSYTFPDHPFVNHHWLSGAVFEWIRSLGGFPALVVLHALIMAFALALMIGRKPGLLTFAGAGLAIPLLLFRSEVRPEDFTYLMVALFVSLTRSRYARWILPPLMMAWANLHIYFVFGFVILGATLFEVWVRGERDRARSLLQTLIFCGLASLVNPLGYRPALYPLSIFSDYGYLIVENQSVPFLLRRGLLLPEVGVYLLAVVLFGACLILRLRPEGWRKLEWGVVLPGLVFGLMGFLGIRNVALFGLVFVAALPSLAPALKYLQKKIVFGGAALALTAFLAVSWAPLYHAHGFDLAPGVNRSAEFFKQAGLKGPIFNNYDIGGYLIYHLFPAERVFVDNRPEAYPGDFFRDVYIPMQEQDAVWKEQQSRFGFNVIYFYWRDQTPWAQAFLIRRVQDPEWVPVYVDDYALIILRNTSENSAVIGKFALPRTMFSAHGN